MTQPDDPHNWSRRDFLKIALALPVPFIAAACGDTADATPTAISTQPTAVSSQPPATSSQQPTLAPTPACGDDDDDATPPQTEGPFYTPSTPERTSLLEQGISGIPLVVTGSVLATDCRPVAGALLDFWHADDNGEYDNEGFRLRGHQFADEEGRYSLETIVPGLYPGRTRHIHVKVQAPNRPVLTTQLYFPGEPGNATDGIYSPELEVDVTDSGDGRAATFNFVLDM